MSSPRFSSSSRSSYQVPQAPLCAPGSDKATIQSVDVIKLGELLTCTLSFFTSAAASIVKQSCLLCQWMKGVCLPTDQKVGQ